MIVTTTNSSMSVKPEQALTGLFAGCSAIESTVEAVGR